jgi:DNA-binding MarR family transcriptional regulator
MNIERLAVIDTMIPLVTPPHGITRGQLARLLKITYPQATQALERLRERRLVKRSIRHSQYIYRLTASRQALSVGAMGVICLN